MPPVFRFAPSPNGFLHLGHALSALLNADMARAAGGRLLLRIEDIDATRCRPEYFAGKSRCGGSPSITAITGRRS
jgi:glutamyl-Q tRNA(Asp) synthetase